MPLTSFNDETLADYDAVFFLSPFRSGELNDTMTDEQDSAFRRFMLSGKGYVGIHCAERLNLNSEWYRDFLGARFKNDIGPQHTTYHVVDNSHPLTEDIPTTFTSSQQVRVNSLFFTEDAEGFTILVAADEKDYPSDQRQDFYPYVWTHDYEGARLWAGSMGHTPDTFASDPVWRELMRRGALYALGREGYAPEIEVNTTEPNKRLYKAKRLTINEILGSEASIYDTKGRMVNAATLSGKAGIPSAVFLLMTNHSPRIPERR